MRTLKLLWNLGLPSMRRQPAIAGLRHDPAPTLWAYRWQRLMLTPFWRRFVRVGLPMSAASLGAMLWAAAPGNRAMVGAWVERVKDVVEERPEFMVTAVAVTGADGALGAAIREIARMPLPVSSFDLDLDALRRRVTDLTAVRGAQVRVTPEGTLEIAVVQRVPVAVWRYADGLRLIDAEGAMTGMIADRAARSDLPLIAGDGAKEAIGEALALFAAAAPIAPRVRGLVRMGERRWDMVLDTDARILLPETGAVAALERVIAMQQAQRLLDRDVVAVDLRLGDRPTIRVGAGAMLALRPEAAAATAAPLADN